MDEKQFTCDDTQNYTFSVSSSAVPAFDLLPAIKSLQQKRLLFHSEADFQFALAWEIQLFYPAAAVRLEVCPASEPTMHLDILVHLDGLNYPIELKYKTARLQYSIGGEFYRLKGHGAEDIGKYDCLLDIQRIEQCKENLESFGRGYTVWLTNDPSYWAVPRKGTMAEAFALHENAIKTGSMAWAPHTGKGTMKHRETPICLSAIYRIHWEPYSAISDVRGGMFRYALLPIEPR